jgi:hypothetical protein
MRPDLGLAVGASALIVASRDASLIAKVRVARQQQPMDLSQKRLRLVTTKGAADIVPVSESQLNKLRVTDGGPEYIKLGSVFYEIEALERWVENQSARIDLRSGPSAPT